MNAAVVNTPSTRNMFAPFIVPMGEALGPFKGEKSAPCETSTGAHGRHRLMRARCGESSGVRAGLRPGMRPRAGGVTTSERPHRHRLDPLVARLEQRPDRVDGLVAHRRERADVPELEILVLLRAQRG